MYHARGDLAASRWIGEASQSIPTELSKFQQCQGDYTAGLHTLVWFAYARLHGLFIANRSYSRLETLGMAYIKGMSVAIIIRIHTHTEYPTLFKALSYK